MGKYWVKRTPYVLLESQTILLAHVCSIHFREVWLLQFSRIYSYYLFFSMENIGEKAILMPSDPLDRLGENLV